MLKQASQPIDKKPYTSPVVNIYGNIRAITQSVGTNGGFDGPQAAGPSGGTSNNKTR